LEEHSQAWIMEWRRLSKERITACHKEREKPVYEGGIRIVDLPVGLEVSQNPGSVSDLYILKKKCHLKYFCILTVAKIKKNGGS